MLEDPIIRCPLCGEQMHRVPQPFTYYNNPFDTLVDQAKVKYGNYRKRKARKRHVR